MRKALLLLAIFCTSVAPCGAQAMDSLVRLQPVEVVLSAPPSTAFDRTMAAFVTSGLQIDRADKAAGTIRTLPQAQPPTGAGILSTAVWTEQRIFLATVLSEGDSSRVVLDITSRTEEYNNNHTETSAEHPLECGIVHGIPFARRAYRKCLQSLPPIRATLEPLAERIRSAGT